MIDIYNILDSISELVYVSDITAHKILYMNSAGKEIFGDCIGKVCYEVLHHRTSKCYHCMDEQSCKENLTYKYTSKNTGKTYMVRDKRIMWNNKPAMLEIAIDITEEENSKRDLERRLDMEHFIVSCVIEMHKNKQFDKSFMSLLNMAGNFLKADRIYVFDYNGVTMSNTHEWCNLNIKSEKDSLQNLDVHLINRWIPYFNKGQCVIIEDLEEIRDAAPEEYNELKRQKIERLVVAPLEDNGELLGFIGIDNPPQEKINESELFFATLGYFITSMLIKNKQEKLLIEMSYLDTLTGLYNRNKYIQDISLLEEQKKSSLGVLYMDLNGLKTINDKHGHDAGDKAIKETANIIIGVFGKNHSYRVGGDEFVVLCPEIDEKDFMSNIDVLNERLENTEYQAALGFQFDLKPDSVKELVRLADERMYLDKKHFYRNQKESTRYRFRNDTFCAISTPELLKQLIEDERFVIWLQPRFSVKTGELSGSEALIRFFDEDNVIVSPMDFLPEMQDNNTIHLIDFYVFKHVCQYISEWIKKGKNVKPVSVNMSHQTIRNPNFIENIMNIWFDYNIPKDLIIIEVSEEQENGGISNIVDVLSELKKCGFKIAVDNFGSKYADLYLFADLKFDILKLDGDMVYKIETDKKAHILSTSIAQICHNENIRIVAEGVENEKELDVLRSMGCDEVQGYLFDKPMLWNLFEEKYL